MQKHMYFGVDKDHKLLLLEKINKSAIFKAIGKYGNARFLKTCYPHHKIIFLWRCGKLIVRSVHDINHEEIYSFNEELGTPIEYIIVDEDEIDDLYITVCFENGEVAKIPLSCYNLKKILFPRKILRGSAEDHPVFSCLVERKGDDRDYFFITKQGRALRVKNSVIFPKTSKWRKVGTKIINLKGGQLTSFFKVPNLENQTDEDCICVVYDNGRTRRTPLRLYPPVVLRWKIGSLITRSPYRYQGNIVGGSYIKDDSEIIVLERSDKKLFYLRAKSVPIVEKFAWGKLFAREEDEDVKILSMNNLFL